MNMYDKVYMLLLVADCLSIFLFFSFLLWIDPFSSFHIYQMHREKNHLFALLLMQDLFFLSWKNQ